MRTPILTIFSLLEQDINDA